MSENIGIVIVAGGSGTRMGADVPKQFINLGGRPVLMRSIEKFHDVFPEAQIVVVLPPSHAEAWSMFLKQYDFRVPHRVAAGGGTRFESVAGGLRELGDCDYIGIHDGVRPLVTEKVITDTLAAAVESGAAVPVVPIVDSLREVDGEKSAVVDRSRLVAVQTPQFFRADIVRNAYLKDYSPSFTDDASVVEADGYKITLAEGDYSNIKITTPADMAIAEALIRQ